MEMTILVSDRGREINYMLYVIMILLIQIITLLAFLTICIVGGSDDYE